MSEETKIVDAGLVIQNEKYPCLIHGDDMTKIGLYE